MSIKKAVVFGILASALAVGMVNHAFAQQYNQYNPSLDDGETMVGDDPVPQQGYVQQYRPIQPPYPQPAPRYEPAPEYGYAQPPVVIVAPQPYLPPPPGAVVYAPGVPPTLATGYWPRGYNPYRAPRPYYGRTYGGYPQPSVGIVIHGSWR